MKRKIRDQAGRPHAGGNRLYTLEARIIGGPMVEEFVKENPLVVRTIEIRGDQSLEQLHEALFAAFDREEEHMYEFQLGSRAPHDPKRKRYVLPRVFKEATPGPHSPLGTVTRTTIGSLELKVEQAFGYWFDFGDDWWHEIKVIAIEEEVPKGKYPRMTKRVGESPPQYPDGDEEESEEDEDEDEDEEED
jgi:hypothetical protein